eukprot:2482848-Rhodomonas_salina.1
MIFESRTKTHPTGTWPRHFLRQFWGTRDSGIANAWHDGGRATSLSFKASWASASAACDTANRRLVIHYVVLSRSPLHNSQEVSISRVTCMNCPSSGSTSPLLILPADSAILTNWSVSPPSGAARHRPPAVASSRPNFGRPLKTKDFCNGLYS